MSENIFDLTGKVSLVTGGNGGIGLGMARGLARAGSDVVVWGRNAEKNAAAREELAQYGVRILTREIDVTSEQSVTDGFADALSQMGRIDFVAANAGTGSRTPFVELETEAWNRTFALNLDSPMWLFREACRHMSQRAEAGDPGGSIAVVSSIAALTPAPTAQAYAASKAGAIALVRSIAVGYGQVGIRANAILPGFIRSDLSAHLQQMEKFTRNIIHGRVPVKRWGEGSDFEGIAVYLASDLSSFHT
ncbi:MAG: SDR family oxidoreductase, partial [Hyphomicrobiaceae bacterium]|nr:SDR family oxidoreductase [Hyphomicrobiaceae bacterium]